jgi:hypothetical protein
MVVLIDKADRELTTDSSVIRHDPPIPWGDDPDAVRLFERSVIGSIQNVIDCAMGTRKHGVGPENNWLQVTKIKFTLTV